LDLSREPYIFSIPDAHGRYFLMPMLDAWTTVFKFLARVQLALRPNAMPSLAQGGQELFRLE
jgi:hypothetical protein